MKHKKRFKQIELSVVDQQEKEIQEKLNNLKKEIKKENNSAMYFALLKAGVIQK